MRAILLFALVLLIPTASAGPIRDAAHETVGLWPFVEASGAVNATDDACVPTTACAPLRGDPRFGAYALCGAPPDHRQNLVVYTLHVLLHGGQLRAHDAEVPGHVSGANGAVYGATVLGPLAGLPTAGENLCADHFETARRALLFP